MTADGGGARFAAPVGALSPLASRSFASSGGGADKDASAVMSMSGFLSGPRLGGLDEQPARDRDALSLGAARPRADQVDGRAAALGGRQQAWGVKG
jgi:hypothetical protein